METPRQLTEEATQQFQEGISLIFSRWFALQAAVENRWGGPHSHAKALDFASRVFEFFHQPNRREPIYIDDLEDLLDEGMDSFNATIDDGSIEEVAEQLMIMHEECLEGNYQLIQRLREVQAIPVPHVRQAANDSDEDEDEEDDESLQNDASSMMLDSPGSLPNPNPTNIAKTASSSRNIAEADDDGWVTVSSRKSRARKN
uniref:Pre-rRNA-processing protein TSR2 homolog n=1 Tax=Opuntia streptacantha TaxID=393608 RepID=A0A7C8YY89_OPUST